MTPFQRFCNGLKHVRAELNEELDEMLAFAEVMSRKQNSIELDDNGYFYVTASGPLEEVAEIVKKQAERLERIKEQRNNPR